MVNQAKICDFYITYLIKTVNQAKICDFKIVPICVPQLYTKSIVIYMLLITNSN